MYLEVKIWLLPKSEWISYSVLSANIELLLKIVPDWATSMEQESAWVMVRRLEIKLLLNQIGGEILLKC